MFRVCAVNLKDGKFVRFDKTFKELSEVYSVAVKSGLSNGFILENDLVWGTINSEGVIDKVDFRLKTLPINRVKNGDLLRVQGVSLNKETSTCNCVEGLIGNMESALNFVYVNKLSHGFIETKSGVCALINGEGFVNEVK